MPKIKNKKILFASKLFSIESLDIDFNNVHRNYEIVSGKGTGAVLVIPILEEKFLFISEYAAAIDQYAISFPKGKIDRGESPLETANRELQEEIGYKSNKLTHIHKLPLAPGYITHQTDIVLAEDLIPSKLEGDEPEEINIIECNISEVENFIQKNQNIESRAIASIYLYNSFINREK